MRGVVIKFDSDRGFGFIRTETLDRDVFVHVRQIQGEEALRVGQKVRFELVHEEKGPAAHKVRPGRMQLSPVQYFSGIAAILALVGIIWLTQKTGWSLWTTGLIAINLTTFAFYGFDKTAAKMNWFRIPEAVLHLLELVGGSPAAYVAQRYLRHKSAKQSFQRIFYTIVGLQVVSLLGWFVYSVSR